MARQVPFSCVLLVLLSLALAKSGSINILPREIRGMQHDGFVQWRGSGYYLRASNGNRRKYSNQGAWTVFDGKLDTTFSTFHFSAADTVGHYFQHAFPYVVKVSSYKIFVPEDTPKARYPRSWILWGIKQHDYSGYKKVMLDEVKDADFDRVYRGKIADPGKGYNIFGLEITDDNSPEDAPKVDITVAEVRYFGPRGQFDAHVKGRFTCKRAPQYIPRKQLLAGTPFSSDATLDPSKLRKIFDGEGKIGEVKVKYPPANEDPLILGIVFPSPIEVLQFGGDEFEQNYKIVLEGNKCETSCDELGDDGWELLARGDPKKYFDRKWLVKYPGTYKAYRVKLFRSPTDWGRTTYEKIGEVFLLACS